MYFISYDLGTGGVKASLYDRDFTSLAKCFIEYPTYYPADGWHEQRPEDWWRSVCRSTHMLLSQTGVDNREIARVALCLIKSPSGLTAERPRRQTSSFR